MEEQRREANENEARRGDERREVGGSDESEAVRPRAARRRAVRSGRAKRVTQRERAECKTRAIESERRERRTSEELTLCPLYRRHRRHLGGECELGD